jgi:quercetin dioxygenase-like cupin family protein
MEPSASCPEHYHSEAEECFVLEGEVNNIDRHEYRPGDYVVAQAGTDTIISAPGGPLLVHATSSTGAGLVA